MDLHVEPDPEERTNEVLRALAEPRRRQILRLVGGGERAAGEIAAEFEVTRTAISQHLTVLKSAGLLNERRDGTRRLYSVRAESLEEVRHALDQAWSEALDGARSLVEDEAGTSGNQARRGAGSRRAG